MATNDFSPDLTTHFVRLCLVAAWRPEALAPAQALAQEPDFDWDAVAGLAAYEEVAPLLYVALRDQPWAPAPFLADLYLAYIQTGSRNTFFLAELEKALAVLAAAGIPVLVLKGAALVERVYADVGLRPMVDLDLLLHAQDVPAACDLLAAQGYQPPEVEPSAGLTLAFENELMLQKKGPIPLALELHWSLFDSPFYQHRLPLAWFWQSAVPVRVGATPATILGPEAELLHLCGHLALHHNCQGMLWQHDIAAAIVHGQDRLDWDLLLAQAGACELLLPLQTLLPALAQAWAAPIPAEVLARLAAVQPSAAEARIFAQLTAEQRPVVQRFWGDLAAIPDNRKRLWYAWASLFPSPEYMRQRYIILHPLLLPAYYPYRWFVGLREAWRSWQHRHG